MTPETLLEAHRARESLLEVGRVRADMQNRVKAAFELGIRKGEIHQLTGLARSTIDRYLGHRNRYEGGKDG